MGDSRDTSHNHAHRCAPTHVEAAARVVDFLRRETYSRDEHSADPYARGWIDAMQHVERGLRELRHAHVIETHTTPILFEGECVPGEWE